MVFLGLGFGHALLEAQKSLPQEKASFVVLSEADELSRWISEHLADHPIAPYLKYKSFTTVRSFAPEAVHAPSFVDDVVQTAHDTAALLHFGWSIGE
ncbi:MAG: DUF2461 family protein [Bacteroidetes bacterium]|nr:DUF2461 family protein [Bacteroidota bacterium]